MEADLLDGHVFVALAVDARKYKSVRSVTCGVSDHGVSNMKGTRSEPGNGRGAAFHPNPQRRCVLLRVDPQWIFPSVNVSFQKLGPYVVMSFLTYGRELGEARSDMEAADELGVDAEGLAPRRRHLNADDAFLKSASAISPRRNELRADPLSANFPHSCLKQEGKQDVKF